MVSSQPHLNLFCLPAYQRDLRAAHFHVAHAFIDQGRYVLAGKGGNQAHPQNGSVVPKGPVKKVHHGHVLILFIFKVRRLLTGRHLRVQHVPDEH